VLDVAEPVVVALGVFGLLDVWDVPDLFAVDRIGTEFQRRLLGDLQVNAEFVTGLLDDVLEVAPVVPPEDDRV